MLDLFGDVTQEVLLSLTTAMDQLLKLGDIELGVSAGSEFLAGHMGQCQVHVVAPQKDVVANRYTVEFQCPTVIGYRDEGEVGGATAHIANEEQITYAHLYAPVIAKGFDPSVKSGLWLF